jgi:ribosome-associated translation inhibitor RaiA
MHLTADYRKTHVEIDTQQCELPDDEQIRIQADLDQLAAELLDFPQSQLFLKIVRHDDREQYHAQAKLKLPGKTITTGQYSEWLDEALTRCLAKVRQRAEQYKDRPDQQAIDQAARQIEQTSAESIAAPTDPDAGELGRAVKDQDYRRFRLALATHESWVRSNVLHWLMRYPQINAQIGRQFDVDDAAEEVFLMAFERFGDRPDEKTISQWLTEFVDPAVKAVADDPQERQAASYARTVSSPGPGDKRGNK